MRDDEKINLATLAKRLDRTPQQMSREAKRRGFPVHKDGAKVTFVLAEVVEWRRRNIDPRKLVRNAHDAIVTTPDTALRSATASSDGAAVTVGQDEIDTPIKLQDWLGGLITLAKITSDAPPHRIRSWMGEQLFAEQTIADLESLADALRGVTAFEIWGVAGGRLAAEARESYFASLLERVDAETLAGSFEWARWDWAAQRFIERPDWWRQLPNPPAENPITEKVRPLPHRRSNADKRRAVQTALERWPKETDRGIAGICAVDNHTVATIRASLRGEFPTKKKDGATENAVSDQKPPTPTTPKNDAPVSAPSAEGEGAHMRTQNPNGAIKNADFEEKPKEFERNPARVGPIVNSSFL